MGYEHVKAAGGKVVNSIQEVAPKIESKNPINLLNVCGHALYMGNGQKVMTKWEQSFIADLGGRLNKYGDNMKLSEKQIAVLQRIADKL